MTTKLDVVDPADGKLSLREAISQANTHAGADTVVLPAGTFKIALDSAGEDANATGDFDITDAVTIAGAGAGLTIIDGQQKDRVFDVSGTTPSSIKVVFQGLTVRNGNLSGAGGGIRVGNADLVVRDCTISGNRASGNGGGIANSTLPGTGNVKVVRTTVARNVTGNSGGGLSVNGSSLLTVTDSTIRRNSASGVGGGIFANTATLTNSTVSGNAAIGGDGGGIRASTVTLTNSTISGNLSGGSGGGISASTATLANSTVSGNTADVEGGGLFATTATLTNCTVSGNSAGSGGGGIDATTATLTNCTVSGNSATSGFGGGIGAITATLTNCTVSGNSATTNGGGIFAGTATLLNCTVAENSAHTGGGLFQNPGGTFSLKNTIVALNLTDFTGTNPDVSGAFTSQGHNLIGNGAGGTGLGVNFDIVGTSANPIDPKLGPLQNNGGLTQTMALKFGSLAIDHGDNAILPPTDQRGFPRKKDGNFDGIAIVDIGAFER